MNLNGFGIDIYLGIFLISLRLNHNFLRGPPAWLTLQATCVVLGCFSFKIPVIKHSQWTRWVQIWYTIILGKLYSIETGFWSKLCSTEFDICIESSGGWHSIPYSQILEGSWCSNEMHGWDTDFVTEV